MRLTLHGFTVQLVLLYFRSVKQMSLKLTAGRITENKSIILI
jgi:hypothetical protein